MKLNTISGEERFTDGFRMGAKMILEIFEKGGERFKLITGCCLPFLFSELNIDILSIGLSK